MLGLPQLQHTWQKLMACRRLYGHGVQHGALPSPGSPLSRPISKPSFSKKVLPHSASAIFLFLRMRCHGRDGFWVF